MPEDYLDIHDFMDSSKAHIPDVRHRVLFHSSFGCFIVEKFFGTVRKNSEGKEYSTRDVAEDHCIEDLGFIPTVAAYMTNWHIADWMGGPKKVTRRALDFEKNPPTDVVELARDVFFDAARPPPINSLLD